MDNGVCDEECNTKSCAYDGGECDDSQPKLVSKTGCYRRDLACRLPEYNKKTLLQKVPYGLSPVSNNLTNPVCDSLTLNIVYFQFGSCSQLLWAMFFSVSVYALGKNLHRYVANTQNTLLTNRPLVHYLLCVAFPFWVLLFFLIFLLHLLFYSTFLPPVSTTTTTSLTAFMGL